MKIFAQFAASLMGGIFLGIVGSIVGGYIRISGLAFIFGGDASWDLEFGVLLFAIAGVSLGSLLGIITAKKLQKEDYEYKILSIVDLILAIISVILLQDILESPNKLLAIGIITILMPSIALTVIANWQKFSKKSDCKFS